MPFLYCKVVSTLVEDEGLLLLLDEDSTTKVGGACIDLSTTGVVQGLEAARYGSRVRLRGTLTSKMRPPYWKQHER